MSINLQIIRRDAAAISESKDGVLFQAYCVLLYFMQYEKLDLKAFASVAKINQKTALEFATRMRLCEIASDDGTPNLWLLQDCKDDAERHLTALLMAGAIAGIFRRLPDDKWKFGDHADLDGNWPQLLLWDVLSYIQDDSAASIITRSPLFAPSI